MERSRKNIHNNVLRGERKAVSQIRSFKTGIANKRKTSVNPPPFGRGGTKKQKPTAHLISITGSDKNKLEFPVKINRK